MGVSASFYELLECVGHSHLSELLTDDATNVSDALNRESGQILHDGQNLLLIYDLPVSPVRQRVDNGMQLLRLLATVLHRDVLGGHPGEKWSGSGERVDVRQVTEILRRDVPIDNRRSPPFELEDPNDVKEFFDELSADWAIQKDSE